VNGLTRFPASSICKQTEAIFCAWGMSPENARISAERLQHADLRGIDSHGVALIVLYAQMRAERRIEFRPDVRVLRESPVTALIDGGNGLGHVPSTQAMQLAIDKCRGVGLAAVAVRNSNHYGAAGAYALMAAEAGLIGMSFTSVGTLAIVPTFGADAMFGTNPIAFAAPGRRHGVFYLDMATSTVAIGKLKLAAMHEQPLESGWALDGDGRITTDPATALGSRRLTPLGGSRPLGSHKGYGLAAMVEILCTMLTGAWYAPTREARHPDEQYYNVGHFFLAIDPRSFRGEGEFEMELDDMIDALHACRRADPDQPVQVAGDPEMIAMTEREKLGVPVPDALLAQLRSISSECGAAWLLD
jgi:LDH2 family malate/lactate/ureidoglycolate dehydrogenase